MFTYGIGYRMCAGSLLANRELYLLFLRMLNCFRIEADTHVDWHPVHANSDPSGLTSVPRKYRVRFVPKDPALLEEALKKFEPSCS
jgi:3-hydroxyphenylacetate 6-hydroxylase